LNITSKLVEPINICGFFSLDETRVVQVPSRRSVSWGAAQKMREKMKKALRGLPLTLISLFFPR